MDRFQTRVIEAIDKRESPSLKNDITIHNSYHTGNDFTSNIFCGSEQIATVYYTHSMEDLNYNSNGGTLTYNNFDHSKGNFVDAIRNDTWAIDEIVFNERAIARVGGYLAVRYRNFLTNHYVKRGVKIVNESYVTV